MASALQPAFTACFNQVLAADPSLVGCVTVNIKLNADGGVAGVVPDATPLPANLVACVQREIAARRFQPPATTHATLVAPLTFIPEGSRVETNCSSALQPANATNAGRAAFDRAVASTGAEQTRNVREAIAHFRNARAGWLAAQGTIGGEEPLFWHADAAYWIVVLQIATNQTPLASEVGEATAAARAVRDRSPKFGETGAYYLVAIADKLLDDAYVRHERSKGADGLREAAAPDLTRSPVPAAVSLPPLVQSAIDARTDFLKRVHAVKGEARKRPDLALSGAKLLLAYGQTGPAATWLETAQRDGCAQRSDVAPQAKQLRVALARAVGKAAEAEKISRAPACP